MMLFLRRHWNNGRRQQGRRPAGHWDSLSEHPPRPGTGWEVGKWALEEGQHLGLRERGEKKEESRPSWLWLEYLPRWTVSPV